MPAISVIMLIHNREQYVGKMIESIISQTYRDFEFIIIDNASTDNSLNIVKNYAGSDDRIKILHRNASDIGGGRNLGLDNAQGNYFTFVDDDDYCMPDYLGFLYNLIKEHNADIAICGSNYDINGQTETKYVFDELVLNSREQAVENFLLRRYFNSGNPTKLFRNAPGISKIRYTENIKYDDIYTMYKFFVAAGSKPVAVAAKGEPKYVFRRHEGNNSTAVLDFSKLTPEWISEYLKAYRERTKYISDNLPELSDAAKWSQWSYMISMVEKINRFNLTECSKQLEEMISELKTNRIAFLAAKWTRNFEKEWMERYVL